MVPVWSQVRDRAAAILHAVADGRPVAVEHGRALARALLDTEVVALATRVLEGDERVIGKSIVRLALAVLDLAASASAPGSAEGQRP